MCTFGGQTCTWKLPKQTRSHVHRSPRFCSYSHVHVWGPNVHLGTSETNPSPCAQSSVLLVCTASLGTSAKVMCTFGCQACKWKCPKQNRFHVHRSHRCCTFGLQTCKSDFADCSTDRRKFVCALAPKREHKINPSACAHRHLGIALPPQACT